jgi:hypothetical protein
MRIRSIVAIAALWAGQASAAPVITTFIASLTPSQESGTPTVGSDPPACIATFIRAGAARSLSFKIRCNNVTGVTAAHIHAGTADTPSGPILVGLYNPSTPTGLINGPLVAGTITSDNFSNGDAGFDALMSQMRGDGTYVNVHTSANPGGEMRGQVAGVVVPKDTTLSF